MMTLLPIVDRDLRVRARLRSTYRFRMSVAIGAFLFVGVLVLVSDSRGAGGRYGKFVFDAMAWLAFVFCLLEGARNTADCLSAEKREGTLGLLFLTDLRSYDVVVGKLISTSLNSFYGLLAIFPSMSICWLMGGVTFAEFWRLILVLVNTLFFSLTVGLVVSAASRDERWAWSLTLMIVLGLAAAPPLLLQFPALKNTFIAWLGPTTGFLNAMDAPYSMVPSDYWRAVGSLNLMSWLCMATACWLLPRVWQDRSLKPIKAPWWQRLGFPPPDNSDPMDSQRRTMILGGNPAVWLVARRRRRQTLLWGVVIAAAVCSVTAWLLTSGAVITALSILGVMLLLHLALAVWVAMEACHTFSQARDDGTLELLLSTPLTAKEIVEGHYEGLRDMFVRPIAVLFTVEAMLLAAQVYLVTENDPRVLVPLLLLLGGGLVLLSCALDLVAVARYGLWQGLASRKASTAVTKTVLYVLVIPLACILFFSFGILLPVVGPVKNLVFTNYAQEQMRRKFRPLLAGRFGWADERDYLGAATPPAVPRRDVLPSVLPQ
jgi:ABC-type transport system involved in multi-copper enzyme maturation permease subunit